MSTYRIAVLPGDGIGPEVMNAALSVLQAACRKVSGLELCFSSHSAGAVHYRRTGEILPQAVLDDCLAADAVLLAAIGLPDVRVADGTEIQPVMMIGLRRALDLYAAVRPIELFSGVDSPLRDTGRGIDFVIVRENLEGLFASFGEGYVVDDRVAGDSLVITRRGTERVVKFAFELARKRIAARNGHQPTVTCVDKANVFRSYAFFRKVFFEAAARYPEVRAQTEYVDATCLLMVQQPRKYDVVVTENQFGDILSDLGAALVGGLGLAPSAELGDKHGLFQPSHGSAPTLAGRDLANPIAMILSGAMMLRWLGQSRADAAASAAGMIIESAVRDVLARRQCRTPDLGGSDSTQAVAAAIAAAVGRQADSPRSPVRHEAHRAAVP
jgi:3-isopropylmalate dehydrogenase